ncbi:hypothetical protein [Streptomyces sp. NPDC005760]|uniref:hypothetical protein n=1 Tax=Streptomyces sp. NPDC005760 TaxID=3156718 RepID=UPI0033D64E50
MSGIPFRRRYRDSLTARRRPHAVYRPTATSPLWRRYLASLFDVPRTPRPRPPTSTVRATPSRWPMALVLAAVAASLLLGGTTLAVLQAGSGRDLSDPPVSTPALTPTEEPTEEPTGPTEEPTDGPTEEPTEEPTGGGPDTPSPSRSLPGTSGGGELPSTGPSALPLTALGLSLLAVGATGAALARRPRSRRPGKG